MSSWGRSPEPAGVRMTQRLPCSCLAAIAARATEVAAAARDLSVGCGLVTWIGVTNADLFRRDHAKLLRRTAGPLQIHRATSGDALDIVRYPRDAPAGSKWGINTAELQSHTIEVTWGRDGISRDVLRGIDGRAASSNLVRRRY